MKSGYRWASHFTALFLTLTLIPLFGMGIYLSVLTYADLKQGAEDQQQKLVSQVSFRIVQKMETWKQTLNVLGQTPALINFEQTLRRFPDFLALSLTAHNGEVLVDATSPSVVRLDRPPLEEERFRRLVRSRRLWIGAVQPTVEGWPRLPMVLAVPSNGKQPEQFLFASVNLKPLSFVLRNVADGLAVVEGDQWVAHSQADGPVLSGSVFPIPSLNWTIWYHSSWWGTYGPLVMLFGHFFGAMVLVGLVAALLGIYLTKKTKRAIAHQEQLSTIGQMASAVGHEIRTGIAVLKNSLGFIKEQNPGWDEKTKKHFGIIERQINSSNKIVANLLSLSRNRDLILSNVSINAIIHATLEELPKPPKLEIHEDLGENVPPVSLDRDEFKQALSNIFVNSFQAMGDEGRLNVRTQYNGTRVSVTVQDNGNGIDPILRKKVTEPFFTTKSQGTGLGLALVKKFVDRHSGELLIDSEPGQGTTIQLVLNGKS